MFCKKNKKEKQDHSMDRMKEMIEKIRDVEGKLHSLKTSCPNRVDIGYDYDINSGLLYSNYHDSFSVKLSIESNGKRKLEGVIIAKVKKVIVEEYTEHLTELKKKYEKLCCLVCNLD